VQLCDQKLQLQKAKLGPEHPDTLHSMDSLAWAYGEAGKLDLAVQLCDQKLQLQKAKLGPEHPDTLQSMTSLAWAYGVAGRWDLAVPFLEQAFQLQKAKLGPEHYATRITMHNLAAAYGKTGKGHQALALFEETFQLEKAKLGLDHPITLRSMSNLAATYWSANMLDRAIPLLAEALKHQEAQLGRDHIDTLMTIGNLGVNYKDAGRFLDALPLLEEADRAAKKYPTLRFVRPALLETCVRAGETARYITLLQEQLAESRQTLPKNSPELAGSLAQTSLLLLEMKRWAEAEPLLRECLAIREKAEPDNWKMCNTQSMLGGSLLGQKKYSEAEPLLLQGYEGMRARAKTIPKQGGAELRIPEALDRLIELYVVLDKPDAVKKWRDERAKYPYIAPMPREKQ
jgi:tetratricopeptide (TPR) repeat protein